MLNQQTIKKSGVQVLFSFILGLILFLGVSTILVQAQEDGVDWTGEDGELHERGTLVGKYDFVIDGAGLLASPTATVTMTVPGLDGEPGNGIVAAYLYWAGVRKGIADDAVVALDVDNSGTPTVVTATTVYGPSTWFGDYKHHTHVADVTNLVQLGQHAYTFSGYDVPPIASNNEAYGFSLLIVYEDDTLSETEITLLDGLDSVFFGFDDPMDSPSSLNCITFIADADNDRQMDFSINVNGVDTSQPRLNNLYYITGISATTVLTPEVDIRNMPGVVSYTNPFYSANGPEIDIYENSIVIPAGDDVVCFQAESVDSDDPLGASFVWQMGVFSLREQDPTAVNLQSITAVSPSQNLLTFVVGMLFLAGVTFVMVLNRRRQK